MIPTAVGARAKIRGVLSFPDIDPVALRIGPLAIRWYGIAYLLSFGLAWWLMAYRARHRRPPWSAERISDLVFYTALGAIVGGRLGHVVFYDLGSYLRDPLAILKVWQGGMSFHGGLIGSLVAIGYFARKQAMAFFQVADFLAPVVPVGLCLGRIANFVNGELWGIPTDLPWGVVFPDPSAGPVPRHPSQLYEAALEGVLLFLALWVYSARARPARAVSGLFLVGYGVLRFLVEFFKVPEPPLGYLAFGWLTMGQVLSLPMLLGGAWLLLAAYRQLEGRPGEDGRRS